MQKKLKHLLDASSKIFSEIDDASGSNNGSTRTVTRVNYFMSYLCQTILRCLFITVLIA